MRKIIIVVLVSAILLGFLFWKFGPKLFKKDDSNKPITLTIWGLWEDENLIKPVFDTYKRSHPNITISYKFQNSIHYRNRVQTQLTAGEGPDIFMIHNSWLPMFIKGDSLSSIPDSVMTLDEYTKDFYPVIKESFVRDNKIYAIPRGIDGLALYYNEDILKAAGITSPPKTWSKLKEDAVKTTVIDSSGNIKTAGIALGATGNVDHWPDIIGLLFLQEPGADLETPDTLSVLKPGVFPGVDILNFYTSFITDPQKRTWDKNLESSTQAFASGKLAFYLAPSWRAHELRISNPQLKFKTAPVPILDKNISWASFWGYAVSKKSQNQKAAWEFLRFFASKDVQKQLYQEASNIRLFGLPYSRIDLQNELLLDPIVGSFVEQGPNYKYWYMSSKTFDEGINDNIIKYYEDAINSVLDGKASAKQALETVTKGVKQVLDEYRTTPVPAKK